MHTLLRLLLALLLPSVAQGATLLSETFEGSCDTILSRSYSQSYSGFPCTGGPMSSVTSPLFAGLAIFTSELPRHRGTRSRRRIC